MTPSFADAAKVLEAALAANWSHTSIHWDGTPPQAAPATAAYLDFAIYEGPSAQVGMPFVARCSGIAMGRIKTPAGKGTRQGRDLADKLVTIFAGKKFQYVTCRMGTVRRVPQTAEATDEQFTVSIPFYYHAQ